MIIEYFRGSKIICRGDVYNTVKLYSYITNYLVSLRSKHDKVPLIVYTVGKSMIDIL